MWPSKRDSLGTREMLRTAGENIDVAEQALTKCTEAEMPFLKGIEILPAEESSKAIKDSETASSKAESAVNTAKNFIKTKLAEVKKYGKELAASVTEELNAHQQRLDAVSKKLTTFKKETSERKASALLAEVHESVTTAESAVKRMTEAAEVFFAEDLDSVSEDRLKQAKENTSAVEKEASEAVNEARKVFNAKRSGRGQENSDAMNKLHHRINAANGDLSKAKRAAASGDKLIKGKEIVAEHDKLVTEIEEEVKQAERKVKPGAEEAALGIESAKPSDEDIEQIGTALDTAQKTLKASLRVIEATSGGGPASLKAALSKLAERCKAVQKTIGEILGLTKEQRERVMTEAFLREGKAKSADVEAALEKVNEAELPFLKGLEVLPLEEATNATKASEAAAVELQSLISAARTFIAAKNLEIKHYGEVVSKPAIEEFGKMTERINAVASKLAQFRDDTKSRKKTAMMQEAGEKMTNVEAEVAKLTEAVEPFSKEGGDEAEVRSEEETERLVEQLKATQAAIEDTKNFIGARQKDVQGNADHVATIKALNKRMQDASATVSKHRKVASVFEAKYAAKRALAEANQKIVDMEEQLKKAEDAAAPIVADGCERFLVAESALTLAQAWREHMLAKELTHEALFAEVAGGASDGIPKDAFVEHLARLPEALGHEECAFSEARRAAIFAHADADGDGKVSLEEFKALFLQRFVCVKEVSVTEGLQVAKSKTVAKIESGETLETFHGVQTEEATGMKRIECTIASSGKAGFVTLESNSGTTFLEKISPFSLFCKELAATVGACSKEMHKSYRFFQQKLGELGNMGKDPAVAAAKSDIAKLKPKAGKAQGALQKLKDQIEDGKKEFPAKARKERNAHIEARERREAEALIAPATAKVEALEAALAGVEEAAKAVTSLSTKEEVLAFDTPIAISAEVERLSAAVTKAAAESKEVISAQQGQLPKVVKGPMMEAKRELMKLSAKSEQFRKKSKGVVDAVKAKGRQIVDARAPELSDAMRAEMRQKGLTVDSLFMELVAPGDEKISHEAFARRAEGLVGAACKAEHIALVAQHIEAGGIGRRKFQAFLQKYYKVVKSIALTNDIVISNAKSIRKLEEGELVELLEGPKTNEKLGLTRIRGKSLADGAEGWISLQGNQGTPFLEEIDKPFYVCTAESKLTTGFDQQAEADLVRALKPDEVMEFVEGPRKRVYEPALRVKGKATSDGAIGWFTARDKTGAVFAEADNKYYKCTASVAMTDDQDIKTCKVVKKLAVDEIFIVEEGPTEDSGLQRVRGKCIADGQAGWVTIKGNAGTVYAEESSKHYCVLQPMPLTKMMPSAKPGETVRQLERGEAIQALENPRKETAPAETRVKVRAAADGVTGWVSLTKEVRRWTPQYKCKSKAPLHPALAVEGADATREIASGETVECLEGPVEDGKVLRMKARAQKDGVVGWVTIRDGEGARLFDNVEGPRA